METRAVASDYELYQATRLTLEAFCKEASDEALARRIIRVRTHPAYRPELVRLRVADSRVIAHLQIVDRTMGGGLAEWRIGGITSMCTAAEARQQDHATALMADALEVMCREGFDISVLRGINHFYERFGYAVVWPSCWLSIPLAEALTLSSELNVRPALLADVPALLRLYNEAWESRPGALARDRAYWRWLLEAKHPLWVAVDREGAAHGYVSPSEHCPGEVVELVAADAGATRALVRHIANMASNDGVSTLRIAVARDDPIVRWLRRVCQVTLSEETTPAGGWMARFINLHSAMSKLQEGLTARLLRSALRDWRGRVNFVTDLGTVALVCRHSHVSVVATAPIGSSKPDQAAQPVTDWIGPRDRLTCQIPQDRLMQMVWGFRSADDVAEDPGVVIPHMVRPLLDVLFPPVTACMAGLDWF